MPVSILIEKIHQQNQRKAMIRDLKKDVNKHLEKEYEAQMI